MTDELSRPDPVCADCIAFNPEGRNPIGQVVGSCKFRPEMGLVPETLPYCHVFQVRRSRADLVAAIDVRAKAARRPSARSRPNEDDDQVPRATLARPTVGDTSGEISMDRDGLKQVLRELLEEETLYGFVEMGKRWQGGTLVLRPADPEQQAKEIPLDTFWHKVVMLRDRLRVLEAKINGHDKLTEAEKVELQQYVSKAYGTLTTFNVLFRDKSDHFRSGE